MIELEGIKTLRDVTFKSQFLQEILFIEFAKTFKENCLLTEL